MTRPGRTNPFQSLKGDGRTIMLGAGERPFVRGASLRAPTTGWTRECTRWWPTAFVAVGHRCLPRAAGGAAHARFALGELARGTGALARRLLFDQSLGVVIGDEVTPTLGVAEDAVPLDQLSKASDH